MNRIRKLFLIGLCAGIMVLVGDMLLGWGVSDETLTGIEKKLSTYANISDNRIFWSAMLGFVGIPIEGLCYFGVYRLIAPYSEKYAHMLRSGILGYHSFSDILYHSECDTDHGFCKRVYALPEMVLDIFTSRWDDSNNVNEVCR